MRRNFSIKRIVSLLIAVMMVVSIMPAAFALSLIHIFIWYDNL